MFAFTIDQFMKDDAHGASSLSQLALGTKPCGSGRVARPSAGSTAAGGAACGARRASGGAQAAASAMQTMVPALALLP
jgi:hypothetical protein